MAVSDFFASEAPARVLALMLSADGSVNERTLGVLDRLDAFSLLGVRREHFIELARDCCSQLAPGLCERSWLSDEDITLTTTWLDAVRQPDARVLVCRLAAAAIEDDGRVTHGARLVFDHALAHWHIDAATLTPLAG